MFGNIAAQSLFISTITSTTIASASADFVGTVNVT